MLNMCKYIFVVAMTEVELQQYFDDFFEEVFTELELKVRHVTCMRN